MRDLSSERTYKSWLISYAPSALTRESCFRPMAFSAAQLNTLDGTGLRLFGSLKVNLVSLHDDERIHVSLVEQQRTDSLADFLIAE